MDREQIARVAHTINRAYCQALGDDSQPEWDDAPDWQRQSALAGVDMHLANPDATPEDSHDAWLAAKLEAGWAYGPTKDVEAKLHPCVLPFDELPEAQRVKDHLFRAVVHACKGVVSVPEVKTQTILIDGSRVPVKYIGPRQTYTEGAYGSYIQFTHGQTLAVPAELAAKLLRHPDQYVAGDAQASAQADPKATKAENDEERAQEVRDSIANMTKATLQEFAQQHFNVKIPRDLPVMDMRARVTGLFEQFGLA